MNSLTLQDALTLVVSALNANSLQKNTTNLVKVGQKQESEQFHSSTHDFNINFQYMFLSQMKKRSRFPHLFLMRTNPKNNSKRNQLQFQRKQRLAETHQMVQFTVEVWSFGYTLPLLMAKLVHNFLSFFPKTATG